MKEAYTKHDLTGQLRKTREGIVYKVISFSKTCFINNHCTWLIEYVKNGKRFYAPESEILKDRIYTKKLTEKFEG